ncbi:MAG: four helix bundle protein [Opitutales bacterium]|jgi:four helix bundle protein|nr:four helix bundle protein [Opitutales bacterium]MDP4643318.1 four helix bundle protein [Opitutales bacterium]MDP4693998.1 four helix bundle protein [Opitutales bacterium]MDP4777712.1 four helix bundle protein [Opitutales bacterium]MDP4878320.1 four helix bundle protein [Opitutales bacterium]
METNPTTASFEQLLVWQKAHQFVLDTYQMTQQFPDCEKFGLTSQFRRAAVSIPANIAEGYGKRSSADKARFFNIAQGSLNECRYYLRLAADLGYAKTETHFKQIDEIGRMLNSYSQKVLASSC